MHTNKPLPLQLLQSKLTDFSPESTVEKIKLLKTISFLKLSAAKQIKQYHNQLLFLLSYAQNQTMHTLASAEMQRICDLIKQNRKLNDELTGSGIAHTVTQGAYSLTLIKWLLKAFPGQVTFHSFDESGIHPKDILKHCLNDAEFELSTDEKLKPVQWLQKAAATKNKAQVLIWLIESIESLKTEDLIKDQLFESLKLYVEISPSEKTFSRSFGKLDIKQYFFHEEEIIKKFDEAELINKKIPAEKKLGKMEKEKIVTCARVALCLLIRETDPVTYSNELSIKYYELERGLSIALFSIDSKRRLPFESYAGFMMFKNGYPMSYGGAWLFGKRSLIGINIFEAFRGGESAFVFAQLLRTYRMAFGATYFEVEPYQFGKDNPEGIKSGAFWFYFRFGFRPVDKKLFELSLSEQNKIATTKGYRTSFDTLKQFTKSNLFARFDSETTKPVDPSQLSRFISSQINLLYKGNRKKALSESVKLLRAEKIISSKTNKLSIQKMAFFTALCIDIKNLSAKNKEILSKLIHLKCTDEFEYALLLQKFSLEKNLNPAFKQFLL